jgi:uncharacterized protein (TIGR02145 family)
MEKLTICFLLLMVTFSAAAQPEKLDVAGSIKIGNSGVGPLAGMIRWTGLDFEGYNGINWISLSGKFFGTVMDIDGNIYLTLKIGSQEWMLENLRTSRTASGTSLAKMENDVQWANASEPAYCWFNNDSSSYERPFGKLYNQWAVIAQICPDGWHAPSDAEWTLLTDFLGGPLAAGSKLKERGTTHWSSNIGATNESGFTGHPGSFRRPTGTFGGSINQYGYWWSTTFISQLGTYFVRQLSFNGFDISSSNFSNNYGCSVRCIRNQ